MALNIYYFFKSEKDMRLNYKPSTGEKDDVGPL